jgi:hypothetical protein
MTPSEKELFLPLIETFIKNKEAQLRLLSGERRYGYLLGLRDSFTAFDSLFNLNTHRRLMSLQEFTDFAGFVDSEIKKYESQVA